MQKYSFLATINIRQQGKHAMQHILAIVFILLILGLFSISGMAAHENCIDCHITTAPTVGNAGLVTPLPDLCMGCHPDRAGDKEHVIDVFPKPNMSHALPLINGKISCNTCHDIHSGLPSSLRMQTPSLCQNCHHK